MENGQTLKRKERLFDCYAANLSACRREYTESFACPLCLRLFDRGALAACDVTEEHVVPHSLGGRVVTLTCRDCNSEAGSRLESHLVRRLERDDFISGVSKKPQPATISIAEGEIGGVAHRYPDRIEHYGNPELSNPRLYALAVSALQSGAMPLDVQLRLASRYQARRSWVAILRMGYLLAFCYFGYGYILHPSAQQVREQILCPDDEIVPSTAVACPGEVPHGGNVIGLLYEPSELRCFFAVLRVRTSVVRYMGVVLPGPSANSQQLYERWAAVLSPIADVHFKALFIPLDPDFVCGADSIGFAGWLWREIRRPLATWARRSEFHYDGSVEAGTDIWYGREPYHTRVTEGQYTSLLREFRGGLVSLGTSRQPPSGSVGAWLMEYVTKRAIASYVGPILVHEGYAERVPSDSTKIRFK